MTPKTTPSASRLFSKSFRMFLRRRQPWLKDHETASLIRGWVLLNQALIHITASNREEAGQKLDQMKILPGMPAGLEAEYHLARCNLYNQFNCLDELNECLARLKDLAIGAEAIPVKAQCLYYRASMEASAGDYRKAADHYLEALRTQENDGDRDFTAEIYNDLGFCARRLKNGAKGEEYYMKSLKLRRETGNLAGQAESLNNLGLHYMKANQHQKAEESLKEAYDLERLAGDRIGEGYTLLNLGVLAYNRSQFSTALRYYRWALSLRKGIGDVLGQGYCYNQLAHLALLLETPEAAYQNAVCGRDCFSQAGDVYGTFQMDVQICCILLELDEAGRAEEHISRISSGSGDQGTPEHQAKILIPKMKLEMARGRPDLANLRWLEYVEHEPGFPKTIEGMLVQGEILAGQGHKDKARDIWRQALAKASEKVLLCEKAKVLLCLGRLEPETKAGKDALNEALGLFKNIGAPYWERKTKKIMNRETS